jgi:hypothetical protein
VYYSAKKGFDFDDPRADKQQWDVTRSGHGGSSMMNHQSFNAGAFSYKLLIIFASASVSSAAAGNYYTEKGFVITRSSFKDDFEGTASR